MLEKKCFIVHKIHKDNQYSYLLAKFHISLLLKERFHMLDVLSFLTHGKDFILSSGFSLSQQIRIKSA